MWVWREPKGGKYVGVEGHPLFRRRDREGGEKNQRGKAKRGRDEKMQPIHQPCFAHVAVFGEFFDRYMSKFHSCIGHILFFDRYMSV